MKHTLAKIQSQEAVRLGEHKDPTINEIGYAVRDQTSAKHLTYAPLIEIARKQAYDQSRPTMPTFIAAVAATSGEVGIETVKLQEFLTMAYAKKLAREGDRDDGFSIKDLTADYRNRFRNRIQVAVAKGVGCMIMTCGLPIASCKKYREISNIEPN